MGALTSEAYRFRARPWDIEDAGSVCTFCPSQCNVNLTVRDEQVKRVLGRDNLEVDDGWLCDKGRFGFQMIDPEHRITQPMVRRGGALRPRAGPEAIEAAADGLRARRAGRRIVGGTSNEEGYLVQRIVRGALGSRTSTSQLEGRRRRGDARPRPRATLPKLLGCRDVRSRHRRVVLLIGSDPLHDADPRPADPQGGPPQRRPSPVASERPTALDGGADEAVRYAPGDGAGFLAELAAAVGGTAMSGARASWAGAERIVVVCRAPPDRLGEAETPSRRCSPSPPSGRRRLLEVPETPTPAACARPAASDAGPGFRPREAARGGIRAALEDGEDAAFLVKPTPSATTRTARPGRGARQADFVVAISMFENASTKHADVVFPAETHAEKEGTVTHPDGRLQRVRPTSRIPARCARAGRCCWSSRRRSATSPG